MEVLVAGGTCWLLGSGNWVQVTISAGAGNEIGTGGGAKARQNIQNDLRWLYAWGGTGTVGGTGQYAGRFWN